MRALKDRDILILGGLGLVALYLLGSQKGQPVKNITESIGQGAGSSLAGAGVGLTTGFFKGTSSVLKPAQQELHKQIFTKAGLEASAARFAGVTFK